MRVVIADDAPLIREGVARLLTENGVEVVDDYRWLEANDDPEVKAWSAAHNARARAVLEKLPAADAIKKRLKEIIVRATPARRSSSSRNTSSPTTPCNSSKRSPNESGI